MAKITLDLNRFKASGIYTIEFDASERIVVSTQTIRLVVGFSKIGPFNAPTFLRDIRTARRIFGNIDTNLEARGSFFHRAVETCLSTGPIFALNLLPLNNVPVNEGGDAVDYRSFALAADDENGNVTRALYASFYNKERFWFPDTEYLQATVDSKPANRGRLLNVVNLGQQVASVLIRKSLNAAQYNIPADEYYDADAIPPYIYAKDYMSDYFIDVYIVKGDWTNHSLLAQDPLYSKYFDLRGIRANQLDAFLSLDGITLLGSFTGSIIPNFIDNNGSNQSIDTIVNANVAVTGLFLNINEEALSDYANSTYKVDMIGNTLVAPGNTDDTIDFLSYNTPIKNVLSYTSKDSTLSNEVAYQLFDTTSGSAVPYIKSFPYGGRSGKFGNVLVIPKPIPSDNTFTPAQWEALLDGLTTNSLIVTNGTDTISDSPRPNDFVKVVNVIDTGTELLVQLSTPAHEDANYENTYSTNPESEYIQETVASSVPVTANTINVSNFANLIPAVGDAILIEAPGYAKYFEIAGVATPSPSVTTITVSTAPTTGAPYYFDKWCVSGFPADEFSAYLQASDLKVTLYQATNVNPLQPQLYLWPNLLASFPNDSFGYILQPTAAINSVEGLGQTINVGAENLVTLFNETANAAIAGTWHIVDTTTGPAVELRSTDADFNRVNIRTATGTGDNTNPFQGALVTDIIRVTLPGGQIFRGNPNVVTATVATNLYSLVTTDVATLGYIESYPDSKLSRNIKGSITVDGDRVKYSAATSAFNYLNVDSNWGKLSDQYSKVAYGLNGTRVREFTDTALLTRANGSFAALDCSFIDATIQTATPPDTAFAVYSSLAKNIIESVAIETPGLYDGGKKFKLNSTNAAKIEVGDFITNNDINDPKLIRIITKVKKLDPATGVPFFEYTVPTVAGTTTISGITYVTKFTPIQKFVDRYQFTLLSGFKMTEYHLPGTPAQLEKILGVLETTNVGETLASRDVIQYRYIVDTFNGGLEPQMGPKQYLSRLAKNRMQCMAILNAPSMAEFQASTDPRFTEVPDAATGNPKPVLNTEYIATGGNLSLGPSFTWSLPDEENGAKFIGVFTPNVILRENGKNISIPPAAHVSNNFVRKFINGEPYAIVAGPRRGVLSDPKFVGLEYDFLLRDRENLEPIGLNPIVVVRNVGPMIFANQTAYQRTLSAFNNLHVRDLLVTIEEAVIEILQNYLFEFNDASTRLEIRTLVETYLDVVRNGGGIYDYSVIMDETNNTPEIIDQNFGILDIGIEPSRGLQKFINRITVLKTGAIASGGFAAV
jgi:hypothetical protein